MVLTIHILLFFVRTIGTWVHTRVVPLNRGLSLYFLYSTPYHPETFTANAGIKLLAICKVSAENSSFMNDAAL